MKGKISRKGFLKTGATAFGTMLITPSALLGKGRDENGLSGFYAHSFHKGPDTGVLRRGSWVQTGARQAGDVDLSACEIVIDPKEHSAVQQAAKFLAADIQKISGYLPPVTAKESPGKTCIKLVTLGNASLPAAVNAGKLKGAWEAYHIVTDDKTVWLAGSNFRGTAFAAYTLSERLGIDPLYLWTNYRPVSYSTLVLKKTDHLVGPPVFKYRGFFHDDEDILPRPFDKNELPEVLGDVSMEWYERFFETALRLRMNMTAPYTRVRRRYEIQKCASDWGLHYTSHHYDILLSNPWGFNRFGLAKERGVTPQWDWFENKENMLKFWQAGVEENKDVDAIWPVGLRGTNDRHYEFPKNMSEKEQTAVFREAINKEVNIVKSLLPEGKEPLFHLTLYTEMLEKYKNNKSDFDLPKEVMVIWPDDNDGIMRGLPDDLGQWKHGVYYHLAYLGPERITKQITHITSPDRVAGQFRKIIESGATEFVMTNVSEMREYIMEARLIAEISWGEQNLFKQADPAKTYIQWWTNEYFGAAAEPLASQAYERYYQLFNEPTTLWQGTNVVDELLEKLYKKFAGETVQPLEADKLAAVKQREKAYQEFSDLIEKASKKMNQQQRQYFFEQVKFGLLVDWRPTQAALKLAEALAEESKEKALAAVSQAIEPLELFEMEILRAERPPFEKWYRETWVRRSDSPYNVHRAYHHVREFYYSGGKKAGA